MRVLFFTWLANLRRYADLVEKLTDEGHEVVVASPSTKPRKLPAELRGVNGVRLVPYDEVSDPAFGRGIGLVRSTRDYLWYLSAEQRSASFNRRQTLDRLVRGVNGGRRASPSWPDPLVELTPDEQAALDVALVELERRVPPDPGIVELIRAQRPDVVLVSPLVKQLAHQTEALKAARALGIPTGFLVYSWDNLSNKGRVHAAPDRTFVWNELQRREAEELHGLDPASIRVAGAPHWDAFFEMRPSVSREEFCRRHGFDPARPIVLYLGSTGRICPDEPLVVNRWLAVVRAASGELREANVVIRRHPDEAARWSGWQPAAERVSQSAHPRQRDQSLFDELHHSAAAVGLNTSAQIEAAIAGTPVYTFAAGDLAPGQEGTLHFYYLLKDRGGVVTFAEDLATHVEQLERGVVGDYDRDAIHRFCETFVRPHGVDRPVAPILAREVVELAAAPNGPPVDRLGLTAGGRAQAGAVASAPG